MFTHFKDAAPNEFKPLKVKLENGNICNAYYVKWSNYVYLQYGVKHSQALEWMYR